MTKITAKEARKLSGPNIQDHVDAVYPLIQKAAENKNRSVRLYDVFWVHEWYTSTTAYKEACKILEGDGYKVRFFYEERQFVDAYTIVEW